MLESYCFCLPGSANHTHITEHAALCIRPSKLIRRISRPTLSTWKEETTTCTEPGRVKVWCYFGVKTLFPGCPWWLLPIFRDEAYLILY